MREYCSECTNKPLIEKRRRARINDCLTQLKTIVLGSNEQQICLLPRVACKDIIHTLCWSLSKIEKADSLEMTVEFMKSRLNKSTSVKHPQDISYHRSLSSIPRTFRTIAVCQASPGHSVPSQSVKHPQDISYRRSLSSIPRTFRTILLRRSDGFKEK
ncbi:hypothetical protein DPMN_157647 [Dreissena polymorpha]|uniref:BHLH domain-containing protein n=1 Tax=Dreissena polymorpha TaxID=45954 RepID=A0A9D4IP12_DREPO|nr:hypothetical protein DPMN_157647 [Dreissena polymorpha]